MPTNEFDSTRASDQMTAIGNDASIQKLVTLLTQTLFGAAPSALGKSTQQSITDIVATVTQVLSAMGLNIPGLGGAPGQSLAYTRGAMAGMRGVKVTSVEDGSTRNVYGDGITTQAVASQLDAGLQRNRMKTVTDANGNVVLGADGKPLEVDRFHGAGEQLLSGLQGKILMERGFKKGDILEGNTGRTVAELDAVLKKMEGVVDEKNEDYQTLLRTRKLMDLRDQMAGGSYDEASERDKAQVDAVMQNQWDDIKSQYGFEDSDRVNMMQVTRRGANFAIVTKRAQDEVSDAMADVAEAVKEFGDVIGTEDIDVLMSSAKLLKIDSITTKNGADQLKGLMKEVRTNAEMTGKTVQESFQSYMAVAERLTSSGQSFTTGDVAEIVRLGEKAAMEERTGTYKGPLTIDQRVELKRQQQIDDNNMQSGLYAARYALDNGYGNDEDQAEIKSLMAQLEEARAKGDMYSVMNINQALTARVRETGVDVSNPQLMSNIIRDYKLDSDSSGVNDGITKQLARQEAQRVMGINSFNSTRMGENKVASYLENYINTVGDTSKASGMVKLLNEKNISQLSGEALMAEIRNSELSDEQKEYLLNMASSKAEDGSLLTGEDIKSVLVDGVLKSSTYYKNNATTKVTKSDREKIAESAKMAEENKKKEQAQAEQGNFIGDFVKGVLGTKGMSENEAIEYLMTHESTALTDEEKAGLSQEEQKNLRRKNAEKLIQYYKPIAEEGGQYVTPHTSDSATDLNEPEGQRIERTKEAAQSESPLLKPLESVNENLAKLIGLTSEMSQKLDSKK